MSGAAELVLPSVVKWVPLSVRALAMTSATILMPRSSPFQLSSKRCADMSGPSAWAAETITVSKKTPAVALYNLLIIQLCSKRSRVNLCTPWGRSE